MNTKRSLRILLWDTLRPIYLMVVATLVAWKWVDIAWPVNPDALLGSGLTMGSVVVGFLISAKAIILATTGRGIERIKEMGLMIELADAFAVAVYMAMAFSLVSCIGFFGLQERWYEAVWAGLGLGMLYSFLKITRLLFRIVRSA